MSPTSDSRPATRGCRRSGSPRRARSPPVWPRARGDPRGGKSAVGMLQHRLFHRAREPIEGAVQTRTGAGARDVPATRLPLDRLPQASGEPHVVPEVARARGDERRQRKEPALDRIQDHSVGRHGHAPQPLGGGGEAREPICSSPVRCPTPGDARFHIGRFEGAPQSILVPREGTAALGRGRHRRLRTRNGQQRPQAHERPGDGAGSRQAAIHRHSPTTLAVRIWSRLGYARLRYASPCRRIESCDGRSPYCPYRPSATSNPSTTWPMGAKPSASSRRLSARFTNSCVVRVFGPALAKATRSEEHTSELQSLAYLVCRLLLEKKKRVTEQRVPRHM